MGVTGWKYKDMSLDMEELCVETSAGTRKRQGWVHTIMEAEDER